METSAKKKEPLLAYPSQRLPSSAELAPLAAPPSGGIRLEKNAKKRGN